MLNIDKVDSQILKLVLEKTEKDYVHKKDNPFVDKDGRHKEKDRKRDSSVLRQEIHRLNKVFEVKGVDIYLVVVEDEPENSLQIKVFEKSSNYLIRILSEDEMDRILKKIMGDSGIIFDRRV
ncbi:MAG: hypothetical protein JJE29_01245 [Peptostreptococcaceae bacterium]|nr:hypothetical protein [Peptostreptococcaceae bacterium]